LFHIFDWQWLPKTPMRQLKMKPQKRGEANALSQQKGPQQATQG